MLNSLLSISFIASATRMVWLCFFAAICSGQSQPEEHKFFSADKAPLERFLKDYLKTSSQSDDITTRYSIAFAELNGDGVQEAILYITGQSWCGSGGCPTLVLSRQGSTYRVVTRIPITRPPIRVLESTSKGWRNIGVWVQGGGIQPGYEAELRFDGKSYPRNPSTPPARKLTGRVAGKVVLTSAENGTPLYPTSEDSGR